MRLDVRCSHARWIPDPDAKGTEKKAPTICATCGCKTDKDQSVIGWIDVPSTIAFPH